MTRKRKEAGKEEGEEPSLPPEEREGTGVAAAKKKFGAGAALRILTVLTGFAARTRHPHLPADHGNRVTGTLFGYRRGHVHFAFQDDPKVGPALLIELLAMPTSGLVKEMESGLVRITLKCAKKAEEKKAVRLLEEPLWSTNCNGKNCGLAMKRECGPAERKVLEAVGLVSMGAGVLPGNLAGAEGELMYMRARFARMEGSSNSETFHMMNPDGNGGPELSIFLLRV